MKKFATLAGAAALALIATGASAQNGTEIGVLDCVVEGGVGYVIGSTKDVTCTFKPGNAELRPEVYVGTINKFGVDVGITGATLMQWLVVAPSAEFYKPGSLTGDYAGATAEATVAAGLGANVLVGGSQESVALQPVSVQAQSGVNFAAGIAEFKLVGRQ